VISAIRIVILYSGIDAGHGEINPKMVTAWNFSTSPMMNDRFGCDTHVAGIVAWVKCWPVLRKGE